MIAVGISGLFFVFGMSSAESSPQEAVVASIALVIVVLPYVLARSFSEMYWLSSNGKDHRKRIECPHCKEKIIRGAAVCRFCNINLEYED